MRLRVKRVSALVGSSTKGTCAAASHSRKSRAADVQQRAQEHHAVARKRDGMAASPGRPAPRLSASSSVSTWSSACWASSTDRRPASSAACASAP
jgi:hypothetical protein